MTPPPKPRKKAKYEELVITEYSKKFKSKPEQIVCCSQSSQSHHAVLGLVSPNVAHNIGKRLAERALEKKREKEK